MINVKVLICPCGHEDSAPVKVWESRLPDGSIIHYGQFRSHSHSGQECEWSQLVHPLVEREEVSPAIAI